MRREDMERLAFLYLCDEEDQNILLGKSKMKLEKFLKFEHWTRKLEFWEYNKSLWDRYSRELQSDLEKLGISEMERAEEQKAVERVEFEKLEVWEAELGCNLKKQNIELV